MIVLIAPDSFKGSLTSVEVARAIAAGWRRARPDDTIRLSPLADGGEGTLDAIEAAGGWTRRSTRVTDPIGREIDGTWLERRRADGVEAVVELATASGLSRLRSEERDPLGASSRGTGELILAAVDAATGRRERDTAGAGAAGGVGYALLALQDRFRSFGLQPGIELVMTATGFIAALTDAHLVITGEGRIDAQTAFGKTALGVARRAAEAGIPSIAIGGGVTPDGVAALAPFGTIVVPVVESPMSVEEAMAAGPGPIVRAGERIARLVTVAANAAAGAGAIAGART